MKFLGQVRWNNIKQYVYIGHSYVIHSDMFFMYHSIETYNILERMDKTKLNFKLLYVFLTPRNTRNDTQFPIGFKYCFGWYLQGVS